MNAEGAKYTIAFESPLLEDPAHTSLQMLIYISTRDRLPSANPCCSSGYQRFTKGWIERTQNAPSVVPLIGSASFEEISFG